MLGNRTVNYSYGESAKKVKIIDSGFKIRNIKVNWSQITKILEISLK